MCPPPVLRFGFQEWKFVLCSNSLDGTSAPVLFRRKTKISAVAGLNCIIVEDKNGGQGKGYPNSDQTFQADQPIAFHIDWAEADQDTA